MKFKIQGAAEVGRETLPFEKEIEAKTEKHAKDVVYSIYGSKHGVSRSKIEINSIEEL